MRRGGEGSEERDEEEERRQGRRKHNALFRTDEPCDRIDFFAPYC